MLPADGAKLTSKVQLPDTSTVLPEQVSFDIANSPALLEVIVPTTSPMLPVLLIVNIVAEDDDPTLTFPKLTGETGNTPMFDAVPVALSAMEKVGVSGSFEGILSVAVIVP